MSDAQRAALGAVSGAADYQAAIAAIHELPRLLITWCRPRFSVPLAAIPSGVSFSDQLPKSLSAKTLYDTERNELAFFGIMTTSDRDLLSALSPDGDYIKAVQALYNDPRAVPTVAERWLALGDLVFPLAPDLAKDPDPASVANQSAAANLAVNLEKAEARLPKYLTRVSTEEQVFQQLSSALGVTQAISEKLVRAYPLFGAPARNALAGLTDGVFVASSATITAVAFKDSTTATSGCIAWLWFFEQ
jgi:hypothetical protein